jgi:tetratricopeptide (TPR) repeat protein
MVYQRLAQAVQAGTGEIFERCLSDRQGAVQTELDAITQAGDLFRSDAVELKQARLNRVHRALQSIQGEWERLQKQQHVTSAIATVTQSILTATVGDRLTTFLQAIDPNQPQVLSLGQLQQLAKALQAAAKTSGEQSHTSELQQLASGMIRGLHACQQLETHLVRWLYEPTGQQQLGFSLGGLAKMGQRDPWALWSKHISSPIPQQLFDTLSLDASIVDLLSRQSQMVVSDWVEITVLLQYLQQGLVSWFEQQPYDAKWGTTGSIATFLMFAVLWCQLSRGFEQAQSLDPLVRDRLARGCFQITLQILRAFAHRPYFPLYGGVFAWFAGADLQDALNYLDAPLRQVAGTQEKARILTLLGYSQRILGHYEPAQTFHQQALEIAREAGDRPCEIANLNHLSRLEIAQKNYAQAINNSQRALMLARQVGDRRGEANALVSLGYSQVFSAQELERIEPDGYEGAITYLQQGLQLSEQLADHQSQALCYNSLGFAQVLLGQPQSAVPYLEKGTEMARLSGDRYLQGLNFAHLAEAHYSLHHPEQAVFYGCLGMYLLQQIGASEWRQSAGLLTILQGQLGTEVWQHCLAQLRTQLIAVISADGYDYLPHLLEQYQRSSG